MPKHSESERQEIVKGLGADDRKVYDYLTRSPQFLGEAQIAQGLKAAPQQIAPILSRLVERGLLEKSDPSENRPFAALYRPAPCRVVTVGDWLKGGEHDRGYASLDDIRRDYPSVKTLADPADGAEAARAQAKREAELAAEKARQEEEHRAQQEQEEAARRKRQADKKKAQETAAREAEQRRREEEAQRQREEAARKAREEEQRKAAEAEKAEKQADEADDDGGEE